MDSSGTGDTDTTGPMPITSDDLESSEHEVHTSDVTSTDKDDFQPFALPDAVVEPADGPFAGDLPLVVIPAPIPLASYPALDILFDADADDYVDLFDDEPLEDDVQGEALLAAGDPLLLADAPAEESPAHSPVPDSFESVASAPSHTQSAQHFSHGSDPDRASSAAPAPSFVFYHDLDEDSDPVFPPGFDPDQDIEFIPMDQPMEDLADPVDPIDPAFADHADFEMAFDDPEPAMALEPGDHVVAADHVDPPLIADVPVDPLVAPHLDYMHVQFDRALFEAHIDPRDEHAQHGWIDADDELPPIPPQVPDARHIDFSFSIPQFTPPARPGEGSSAHPFGHVPVSIPVVPQFSTAIPPVPPFSVPPFDPASEPFLWTSPPIMPPSDPYHPFHMGYSIEDVLMSFVVQQEALTWRI
ncbi:hypothetical protein Hdeb2414_s0059g00760521 [Helianthus debilis subsp. tardiflorus]